MKAILGKKKIIIGIVFALLLGTAAFFISQNNTPETESLYETEAAQIGDIATTVETTGSLRAYQSAVFVWATSGIVEAVNVTVGDQVQKDTELASLHKYSLSAEIIQAEADLIQANQDLEEVLGSAGTTTANAAIALREAQEAYDDAVNYRKLLDSQVRYEVFDGWKRIDTPFGSFKIPKFDSIRYFPSEEQKAEADQDIALELALLEDAQRTYGYVKDGPAERDIAAAEAAVLAAQTVLNQAKLSATFDGVITESNVQEGDQVMAGDQAFRVDNLSSLQIDLNVSEIDINNISLGQLVTLEFEAIPSQTYRGEVVEIAVASSSSMGATTYKVIVQVIDADELVRPGMTANTFIQIREVSNVLMIPNQAIRILNGERVVYILQNDDTLKAEIVRLGVRSETYSEVIDGNIEIGDLIVLNPPSNTDPLQ